jgi:hypothetical protein
MDVILELKKFHKSLNIFRKKQGKVYIKQLQFGYFFNNKKALLGKDMVVTQ